MGRCGCFVLLLACLPVQAQDLHARLKKGDARHNRELLLAAIKAHEREIARFNEDYELSARWRPRFARKYGSVSFCARSVAGTVDGIHEDAVEINVGRRDDVFVGALFDLQRAGTYRGTYRITRVHVARSIAVLVQPAPAGPAARGDIAILRLDHRREPRWSAYLAEKDLPLVQRYRETRDKADSARRWRDNALAEMRWYRHQAAARGEPFPEPRWPAAKVLGSPAPRLVAIGFGARAGLHVGEDVVLRDGRRVPVVSVTEDTCVVELPPRAKPPRAGEVAVYRKW